MFRSMHSSNALIGLGLSLGLAAAAFTGCKGTTKTGTSYTQLATRELQTHLNGDLATVHNASLEVLRDDFGYQIKREVKDALEGVIDARSARNDEIRVETFKESDKVTTVQVFTGPFGDEGKSREIINRIEERLPK